MQKCPPILQGFVHSTLRVRCGSHTPQLKHSADKAKCSARHLIAVPVPDNLSAVRNKLSAVPGNLDVA